MRTVVSPAAQRGLFGVLVLCLACGVGGCDAINPAFLAVAAPNLVDQFATLDNAPGHVVVTVVNNATVDEGLLQFLESPQGGNLTLSAEQRRELRPRIRMRVQITYTDGTTQTVEYITGSANLVDQRFAATAETDLSQNDLGNTVALCDVARVQIEPGSGIEVFIPVELTQFDIVQVTDAGGMVINVPQRAGATPPSFMTLQVDQVDADGNETLQANIDPRDVPSPVINPRCGSVVAIVVSGALAVPFLEPGGEGAPSFDGADAATIARIGGTYRFNVSVQ